MKDLDPGTYRLTAMRTGFVNMEYGARGPNRAGTSIKIAPAQKLTSIDLKLLPHGVIFGRIVDEDGEPVAGVQVMPMRHRFVQGRKQLSPFGGGTTNDLGEFRVFGLPPGRYYISATLNPRMMMMDTAQDRSAAPQAEESYLPTYYPGTTDPTAAAQVELTPGQQIGGIEIRLSRARTVHLRGRVVNLSGVKSSMIQLMMMPRDSTNYNAMNRAMASTPGGNFEFRGLAPGSYVLTAIIYDNRSPVSSRHLIDIGSEHVDNFVLNMQPAMEIAGAFASEGGKADLTEIRLSLTPSSSDGISFGPLPTDRVQPDGSFKLTNVSPDKYVLRAFPLPEGFYVKSIRLGEQTLAGDVIDLLAGGGGTLHVTIAEGAVQVEGTVINDKKELFVGATVALIPEDRFRRTQFQFVKTATSDQHGRFSLKNVDPGEYRIYAWEDIENGAWLDPDITKPVESKSKRLSLKPKDRESVEVPLIRNE